MRNVIYKKIGLENFGCYTSPLELEIENGKMVIICGPNGVGKTTIFDSVSFTLYGITSKGLRAKDVVNNKIGKNAHTWLEFTVDGNNYRIDRYYLHTKYGNTAIIVRNDQPYKKGSKEVISEVEVLLAPRKVFMNSLFFGQKVTSFFTDLDDTERKDIFRKILKLDDLVIYYKQCSKMIDELNKSLTEINNNKAVNVILLNDCEKQISLLDNEKKNFEENYKNNLNLYKSKLIDLNIQIKETEEIILQYTKEYDPETMNHLDEVINDYKLQLRDLENSFKNIVEQVKSKMQNKKLDLEKQADNEKFQSNEELNKMILDEKDKSQKASEEVKNNINDINSQILILKSSIENNNREKDRLISERNEYTTNIFDSDVSICPTCKQTINKTTRNNLTEHINNINSTLLITDDDNKNIVKQINQLNSQLIELNDRLFSIKQSTSNNIDKLASTVITSNRDVDEKLKNLIIKLKEYGEKIIKEKTQNLKDEKEKINTLLTDSINERDRIKKGYYKINEFDNKLSSLKYNKEKYEDLIIKLKESKFDDSRYLSYEKRHIEIKKELKSLDHQNIKLKRRQNILLTWKEAFSKSGIESMLIDESIPFMNERVSQYLDMLSFGRYVLSFDTVKQLGNKKEYRDKIDLNVLDNESLADKRDKFSAGQTRILDIAIILTLCDLQNNAQGIKFNLMLFDEIFDSLDDDNIIRVAKLLRSLTKDKSIYIITHRHIDQIDADDELKL